MLLFVLSILFIVAQPLQSFAASDYATIRGTIMASGGQSSKFIPVQLRSGSQVVQGTFTDSGGNFEFDVPRPGIYAISVNEEEFQELEYPIEIAGGPRYVQLVLLKAAPVHRHNATARAAAPTVDVRQLSIPRKAVDQFEKAMVDIRKERASQAIDRLKSALKIAPDYYEAHWQLGLQYLKSDQTAEAEAELVRAAELNPRAADPLVVLGLLHLQGQEPAEAVAVLERAVDLNAASARARYYLGWALHQTGENARAEHMLMRSLELDPLLHAARLVLSGVYAQEGRREEAVRQLDAYLLAEPHSTRTAAAAQMRDQLTAQTSEY